MQNAATEGEFRAGRVSRGVATDSPAYLFDEDWGSVEDSDELHDACTSLCARLCACEGTGTAMARRCQATADRKVLTASLEDGRK